MPCGGHSRNGSASASLGTGALVVETPMAIMALSLIFLFFYPITKEMHLHTLEVLDDARQQKALITTDGEHDLE